MQWSGGLKMVSSRCLIRMLSRLASPTKSFFSRAMSTVPGFLRYVNASPSPFHAVAASVDMLQSHGFERISEVVDANGVDAFQHLKPNGKYFFTRNQSTIVAFAVGGKFKPGNGIHIVAAHTDSPCLKLKPKTRLQKHGFVQVGVECYGGGLWYTWFDRDLSVAGRVIVETGDNKFESKLVRIDRPLLKIPSLAIHLQRSVNDDGFKPNKETHTAPIIATIDGVVNANIDDSQKHSAFDALSKHHPLLLSLIATELGVQDLSKIRDFELSLFDTQPAIVGGALNEFIFSARLDNLLMSYVSLLSLCESTQAAGALDNETNIRMVTLFDHEECGSGSSQGADSNLLVSVLARLNQHQHVESSMRKSFLVSADMAHACHPNYSSVHEDNHRPMMNKGLVFKENANQRYATNAASAFILNEIAKRNQIEVQDFCVRNDAMCGSTVGPILSSNCGVRCVDVGVPQFSMHSIRETCGTKDVDTSTKLLTAFFEQFAQLDACVQQE